MDIRQVWVDLANQLTTTPHKQRTALIEDCAARYNLSVDTIYRRLKKVGWSSGRKARKDKSQTCQDENALIELGALLKLGVRKNGKETMNIPNARSVLVQNGRSFSVSNNQIATLLRQKGMDMKTQKLPTPYQDMRSMHPNDVHQVDPSLCLLYYLNGEQQMKRLAQRWIADDEAYKNKPETLEKIGKLKVWRYVLTDHYSATIVVRYYQAKGESQENLYDFLLYAWSKIESRVFHGVPNMLVWDKGSANTASAIKVALKALQVETYEHKAGNPRAKGSVENANNLVECNFESRLKIEPVNSVEQLNEAVEAWCHAFNSGCIPEQDTHLKRPLMQQPLARLSLWQSIRKEQLRLLPAIEVCRYLLTAEPVERTVKGNLTVSFRHPNIKRSLIYSVAEIPGIHVKAIIKVSPLVYGNNEVIVTFSDHKGEAFDTVLSPVDADELSGFPLNAPVFGQEFKSPLQTVVEQQGKKALQTVFPGLDDEALEKAVKKNAVPFGGLDAHSHLKDVYTPDYMQKQGTEISVPNRAHVEIKPLGITEVCKRLVAELGPSDTINYYQYVSKEYPQGVLEDEFPQLLTAIRTLQTQSMISIAK